MSEPKRQKVDIDSLKFTVSLKGHGLVNIPINQFVDRESVAKAVEEHLIASKDEPPKSPPKEDERKQRVLEIVRTVFPQAIDVVWEEEGGLEDVGLAQYFYESRYELKAEFDMEYDVDIFIHFSGTENKESGIWLSFGATLNSDCGSNSVFFDFDQRQFDLCITYWQTDEINPSSEQVTTMLKKLIKEEIGGMEAVYIIDDLERIDMDEILNAYPRFLPSNE
jgi:hypothetical protein